jgi:hypothetical protein
MDKKVIYPILGLFIGFVLWLIIYGETTGENSVVEEAAIGMGFIFSAVGAVLGFLVSMISEPIKGQAQRQRKEAPTKICPDCLGNIPTLAKKCLHCGTEQVEVVTDLYGNMQKSKMCPNCCSITIGSWALKCPSCKATIK